MRSLALALLPTLLAAAPAPFEAARLRGQELAQRIRLEEACGRLAGQRPSPLLDLGPERWTAYFLDPGAPEAPRASFVLTCPAGKPEALAPQAAGPGRRRASSSSGGTSACAPCPAPRPSSAPSSTTPSSGSP